MARRSTTPDSSDGITRRDFIHDAVTDLGLAGAALALPAGALAAAAGDGPTTPYYPPTKTGLRGTHPGAFEVAHQLAREGKHFPAAARGDEHYDLVIVGAGISGLATAYFYRQAHGPDVRILLLDNHDDFGGHAKRNEFHQSGDLKLCWGGTVNIEHWKYSEVGHRLLRELGIDLKRLLADFEFNWRDSGSGLAPSTWFDKASYGRDTLLKGTAIRDADRDTLRAIIPELPLSDSARESLRRFVDTHDDILAGKTDEERETYLHGTRYTDFLREHGGLTDEVIAMYSLAMMGGWGVRTDDMSIAECLESGLPGGHLLGMDEAELGSEHTHTSAMFPDGNASIARLLVRSLIPQAFPDMPEGSDPFDIVAARAVYEALDRPANDVRLRLNSVVLNVQNTPDGVALTYHRDGALHGVRARQCVLACYNRIIPHICPSLPEAQKAGLAQCIKRPMGTLNVLLKDGRALQRSGVSQAYLPGSMLQSVCLARGVNVGPYRDEWNPDESCMLHFFFGIPADNPEGLSMVAQSQAARLRLLDMEFEEFESEARRVIEGIWGPSGLDWNRDVLAVTVNRWPHGYARDLLDLEDPAWLASPGPYEIGRQPFGNIAIANSDSGADAYTHTAIDQAWRAVHDLPDLPQA